MASEIRVNQIQNRSGLTTTTLNDHGVVVAGVVTATSFSGDITGNVTGNISGATATLTGNIDMKTGGSGNLFLGDDQLLRFGDSNELTIQHSSPGPGNFIEGDSAGKNLFIRSKLNQEQLKLVPDGQVEAYFAGSKKFETTGSGTITTGIVTAAQSADAVTFLKGNSVGIGSTTTTGRDAGIGTAIGEIIYNASDSVMQVWTGTLWETVKFKPPINVSGGTISDSARSGYITHTFTSPGNFVTDGSLTSSEIFVIGGGAGGGGRRYGAGGGAGGAMFASSVTLSSGTYGVSIGSGGNGGAAASSPGGNDGGHGSDGGNSIFNPGGPQQRQGTGGGGGAAYNPPNFQGRPGGCGGGASSYPDKAGGSTTQPSAPGPGTDYGQPGAGYQNPSSGITGGAGWAPAGGGGAGQAGFGPPSPGPHGSDQRVRGGGNGGDGVQLSISGTATYYGGGGGASVYNTINPSYPPAPPQIAPANHKTFGGDGGGGTGGSHPAVTIPPNSSPNQHGLANTGSGGAGGHTQTENFSTTVGGNGGSGLVIVAYPSVDNAITT